MEMSQDESLGISGVALRITDFQGVVTLHPSPSGVDPRTIPKYSFWKLKTP